VRIGCVIFQGADESTLDGIVSHRNGPAQWRERAGLARKAE